MTDITPVIEGIISLIGIVISAVLVPWRKTKLDGSKLDNLLTIINQLVAAAEQIYVGSGRGAEKKAYVQEQLRKLGFTVDTDAVDAYIEAAVHELTA